MRPSIPVVLIALLLLAACTKPSDTPIKIGINTWPGYEFLFLAEQQGIFKEVDANIKLVHLSTLTDAERAFINGRVDGIASTLIEVVQSHFLGPNPIKVVMIPDYSNGGDVIVAHNSIKSVADLKGKSVGCEVSSLGIFVLARALAKAGLELDDVNLVNTAQTDWQTLIQKGKVEAFVSYPPYSIEMLRNDNYHQIFSSAEIPFEIMDSVALSDEALKQDPQIVDKLMQAWTKALDYARDNPQQAYKIMADREGISTEEFQAALSDLIILDTNQQKELFRDTSKIEKSLQQVCETLVDVNAISGNCEEVASLIYRPKL